MPYALAQTILIYNIHKKKRKENEHIPIERWHPIKAPLHEEYELPHPLKDFNHSTNMLTLPFA